jgi:microsomal dipeptidase-like Zn-dependent dipeptidase
MNQVPILDNNFVLLKESSELHSPLGMLHYHRYQSREEVLDFIKAQQQVIQCVVGHGYLPFGSAQCPKLTDYADGIDTMQFLGNFATCLS